MAEKINRAIIVILDSVGVGELPDAAAFGDVGSNTLGNTARAVGGLNLPNMGQMGLGNIIEIAGVPPVAEPTAAYGKMAEKSQGKDTTIGHWEIVGIYSPQPLPTYPQGFPADLIAEYERRIGRKTLGNYPASGTVIIEELGAEHVRTGYPIVYTSADSVFQVAAHEDVIPVDELYRICRIARELLVGEHNVGRVIARPFVGEPSEAEDKPGSFMRTYNRKDFSAPPPDRTLLDHIKDAGQEVWAVGKIEDIYVGQGITRAVHTDGNMDGVDKTLEYMQELERGLIFTNLVDFDMLYGHRNNPAGYGQAVEVVDARLPELVAALRDDGALFITADHGCDPTTPSTDHSREYVPLLVYGKPVKPNVNLGIRATFADLGATVAEMLNVPPLSFGTSFLAQIV